MKSAFSSIGRLTVCGILSTQGCLCRERRGRPLDPPLGLLLVLAFVAAGFSCPRTARADEFTQKSQYSVRLFTAGTLTIETRTGDIRIEGWDRPRVEIEAEKVVQAGSSEKAKQLYERVQIRLEGQDKQVRLSTAYPPRRLWRPFRGESKLSVNFDIRMPYDANLIIRCVDGDVRVRGVVGNEQLFVNYGDVEVDIPDVYRLRSLQAHTWLGYVESDLHATEQDGAGFSQRISFYSSGGDQDILVKVRMGGVWVYRGEGYPKDDYF